jgi:hypothetical protein
VPCDPHTAEGSFSRIGSCSGTQRPASTTGWRQRRRKHRCKQRQRGSASATMPVQTRKGHRQYRRQPALTPAPAPMKTKGRCASVDASTSASASASANANAKVDASAVPPAPAQRNGQPVSTRCKRRSPIEHRPVAAAAQPTGLAVVPRVAHVVAASELARRAPDSSSYASNGADGVHARARAQLQAMSKHWGELVWRSGAVPRWFVVVLFRPLGVITRSGPGRVVLMSPGRVAGGRSWRGAVQVYCAAVLSCCSFLHAVFHAALSHVRKIRLYWMLLSALGESWRGRSWICTAGFKLLLQVLPSTRQDTQGCLEESERRWRHG